MNTEQFRKKYNHWLHGSLPFSDIIKHKARIVDMVVDYRSLMDKNYPIDGESITLHVLSGDDPSFDYGIKLVFDYDDFGDLNTSQTCIYHFLYGDWVLYHLNKMIEHGYAKLHDIEYVMSVTSGHRSFGIDMFEYTFDENVTDEDFMTSPLSNLDREQFTDGNSLGYIYVQRLPDWMHQGSRASDRQDDEPDYYIGYDYIDFVNEYTSFPNRDEILDLVDRWCFLVATTPGIELLTEHSCSDELRQWALSSNGISGYGSCQTGVLCAQRMPGVVPGPLHDFDYLKEYRYKGEMITMEYRVFVSRNSTRDVIAIKKVHKTQNDQLT